MSSVLSTSDHSVSSRANARSLWPQWLREPLLHFVILGAVLFGADHVLFSRADDPSVIVVDAAVDREAIEVFKEARGRDPNADELYALRRVWLDNEVLHREGLAMELDKGDKSIRERVIFKALSVIDASTKLPAYTEQTLRDWFTTHRARYDDPTRFDFQEAVLSGESSEAGLKAFAAKLNAGTPDDAEASLRVFKGRPHDNVVQSYGEDFATAMEALPIGEWRALQSKTGWRVMRLEAITPATPAEFDTLRGVVLQDWTDVTMAEQRSDAVKALARKYTVKVEAPAQ